jgi:hypothetical protein
MTLNDATPLAIVTRYFAAIHAGDERVAEIFHEDAELVGLGTVVRGRRAIHSFYAASIAAARPSPKLLGPCLVAGNRVAAEIEIALVDAPSMHVMDLFEIDGERIRRLTYFVADSG